VSDNGLSTVDVADWSKARRGNLSESAEVVFEALHRKISIGDRDLFINDSLANTLYRIEKKDRHKILTLKNQRSIFRAV